MKVRLELIELIDRINASPNEVDETSPLVNIDLGNTTVSTFYERFRNFIDYKEEHLLRQSAIERILVRKLRLGRRQDIAKRLIKELTLGSYIENNKLRYNQVVAIDNIIQRYLQLLSLISKHNYIKYQVLSRDLMSLCAVEIENLLMPHPSEDDYLDFVINRLDAKLNIPSRVMEADLDEKLYFQVATQKALFQYDNATITLSLLKTLVPSWSFTQAESLEQSATAYPTVVATINQLLRDPVTDRLTKLIKKSIAPYLIIDQIIKTESPSQLINAFNKRPNLENKVWSIYQSWHSRTHNQLTGNIIRIIIYIFIAKVLLGLFLEIPYDIIFAGKIDYLPLSINLIFPPLLMMILTTKIRTPKGNLEKLVTLVNQIVYEDYIDQSQPASIELTAPNGKNRLKLIFNVILTICYIALFGGVIYGLYLLNFTLMSGLLFFFFFSVVSFFAVRIRQSVNLYTVTSAKRDIFSSLINFLAMPFMRIGQWLSATISQFNVILFILDLIIEAPFKAFFELFSQWQAFIKEKQDEIG